MGKVKIGLRRFMYRTYRYRIYPNKKQEELIQKTFGCVRYVYNHFLYDRIESYKQNKKSNTFICQSKILTSLRRENEWLQEPDRSALQCALRQLDASYTRFFRNRKQGLETKFPQYKRKGEYPKTYFASCYGGITRVEGNKIHLPKLGFVKASISRQIPDNHRIMKATVIQTASGKYFISMLTEYNTVPHETHIDPNKSLGLDYSSTHFYVSSENQAADMPHFYRKAEKKLAREQRKLANMQKGSSNWKKQKKRLANIYEKIRNQRMDWQHKQSTILANQYDVIGIEGINYLEMAQEKNLAKATYDNGFGQFKNFLDYKMADRGKKLVTIDKWFPSSKMCHYCGAIHQNLQLYERVWICPSCGKEVERDWNAAINIKNKALEQI